MTFLLPHSEICGWCCGLVDFLLMKCRWQCLLSCLTQDGNHLLCQLPNSAFVYIDIFWHFSFTGQLSKECQEIRVRRGRHATKVTSLIRTGDFAVMFQTTRSNCTIPMFILHQQHEFYVSSSAATAPNIKCITSCAGFLSGKTYQTLGG